MLRAVLPLAMVLGLVASGCTATLVELKVQKVERSPDLSSGSATYHCEPTCYRANVLITNRADRTVQLDGSHWQVVWPAGQAGRLLDLVGSTRATSGASFAIELLIGGNPDRKDQPPQRLELYDRDPKEVGAAILGRILVDGEI